jgi:hypothetical protein
MFNQMTAMQETYRPAVEWQIVWRRITHDPFEYLPKSVYRVGVGIQQVEVRISVLKVKMPTKPTIARPNVHHHGI